MLRVTRLTDYATLILATLARQPSRVHAAAELAEQAHLELPTVAKVLKPLARAGLVESFRGANGGYRLARPAAQIALIDVVEAIEGPLGMTECSGDHSNCELESHCGVAGQWRYVNDIIAGALRSVSLAEMVQQQPKRIPLQLAGA